MESKRRRRASPERNSPRVVLSTWRFSNREEEDSMGKGILLWLLGVPIPVIIILWLIFR
jgi:hypothetical protein